MGKRANSEAKSLERQAKVAEFYLQGWSQLKIAAEVGSAQSTISRDLKAIREEWRKSRIRDFEEAIAIQLEKIDLTEREAWSAWERSQQDAVSKKNMMTGGECPTEWEQEVRTGQYGDPRFLKIALECVERRCKLLGLDAPEKHQHTGADGRPLVMEVVVKDRAEASRMSFSNYERIQNGSHSDN